MPDQNNPLSNFGQLAPVYEFVIQRHDLGCLPKKGRSTEQHAEHQGSGDADHCMLDHPRKRVGVDEFGCKHGTFLNQVRVSE
jgi:hypothetical protein